MVPHGGNLSAEIRNGLSGKVEAIIQELETVVLTKDLPGHGLKAGDLGTVVMVHGHREGFEVEFVTLTGATVAVLTVKADSLRTVAEGEIAHVRRVA